MTTKRDPFKGHPVIKSKLAKELGITHGAICQWQNVPPERVLAVEQLTGISRHVLRPDVYGPAMSRRPKPQTMAEAS